jgi:hypothetical protein
MFPMPPIAPGEERQFRQGLAASLAVVALGALAAWWLGKLCAWALG